MRHLGAVVLFCALVPNATGDELILKDGQRIEWVRVVDQGNDFPGLRSISKRSFSHPGERDRRQLGGWHRPEA